MFIQGGPQKTVGFKKKNFPPTPLILNIDNFYLYRHKANVIAFFNQMKAVFTNTHY